MRRFLLMSAVGAALLAPAAGATTLPEGFRESVVLDGLVAPTAVEFARDGRVFVAEKTGRIQVFSSVHDPVPTEFADLTTQVHNYWDRGLLALELHPDFPETPYVYVGYTHDAAIGGTAPRWGLAGLDWDDCPGPPEGPGGTEDGCVVSSRVSRLTAAGDAMTGAEHVLLEDWCQQFPSHSIGDIHFGPDGALYVSGGDGASFGGPDYGQFGDPLNPCGDPPAGVGGAQTPPDAEGGALRSQDLRTPSDPVTLDGTILRLDPQTGAAMPGNPLGFSSDANARRVIAYGLRNPFRFTFRPGSAELWLGDVGSGAWEEVNRIADVDDLEVENFGWPCNEGNGRLRYYDIRDLTICERLYDEGTATRPFHAYEHDRENLEVDCPTGTAAISGIDFYEGGSYPGYQGTLFFADYAARCIWAVRPGPDGAPHADAVEQFAVGASMPVDLEIGPGGDLFYADVENGTIRRIRFESGNHAPTARIDADRTSGPAPLAVELDGRGSNDPDPLDVLTYAWDLDGDGEFDDAEGPDALHVFERFGTYTVRLRVRDSYGETDTTALSVSVANSPPEVRLVQPASGTVWSVGSSIHFAAAATDPDDGELPPAALSWSLALEHCPAGCHTHQLSRFERVGSGSFTAPEHEYPSHLELTVTATDSGGLADSETIRLDPRTVRLTFETSPAGLLLAVGAETGAAPLERVLIAGSRISVSAPSPQPPWLFVSWGHDAAQTHELVAPATPRTYTAIYAGLATPTPPPPPPPPEPPAPPPQPDRAPRAATCTVPPVVGRRLTVALLWISQSGCRPGRITRVHSRVAAGRVAVQRPKAGPRLAKGARVALVVSRGPKKR